MKRFLICMVLLVMLFGYAVCEEVTEETGDTIFYVLASDALNCRYAPKKKSVIATSLANGQTITGTGKWSKDHKWVEIDHFEYGKLWCSYQYLTERTEPFYIETLWDSIKIRKTPVNGTVVAYLRKGKEIEVTQVVLGWGKTKSGWIDLEYCIEIEK